jgi:hypothetical protein
MSDELDSVLSAMIASHKERLERAKQGPSAEQEFYRAWNQCRIGIVEPALKEIAAALQQCGYAAKVSDIPAHRVVAGSGGRVEVSQETNGIALYLSDTDGARGRGGFSFEPQGRLIVLAYAPSHSETLDLAKVTRDLIRQRAVEFLKGYRADQ